MKKVSSETYNAITTFLHKSFTPVRLRFPRHIVPQYKNHMFNCQTNKNNLRFNTTNVLSPVMYMAKAINPSYHLSSQVCDLGKHDMRILDTCGMIPTRYIYMLKDFFFKDQGIIDYDSVVQQ